MPPTNEIACPITATQGRAEVPIGVTLPIRARSRAISGRNLRGAAFSAAHLQRGMRASLTDSLAFTVTGWGSRRAPCIAFENRR